MKSTERIGPSMQEKYDMLEAQQFREDLLLFGGLVALVLVAFTLQCLADLCRLVVWIIKLPFRLIGTRLALAA